MISLISEKLLLENGDSSLMICPPKWKRRKVSAVRDFPPGCGPNVQKANQKKDEGVVAGVTIDSVGQETVDPLVVERKKELGNIDKSDLNDLPSCSNGVTHVESVLVKCDGAEMVKVEHAGEEFPKELERLGVDVPPKAPLHDAPDTSSNLQTMEVESTSKELPSGADGPRTDLIEIKMGSPRALKDTDGFDHKDADIVNEERMAQENGEEQCLLPHYPIPSNIVWKQRKYPLRRKVSAVRDFPPGFGSNASRLSKADNLKAVVSTEDKQSRRVVDDEDVHTTKMRGISSGEHGVKLEALSVSHESACGDTIIKPVESEEKYEVKEQQRNSEGERQIHHESNIGKSIRKSECKKVEGSVDIAKKEVKAYKTSESNKKKLPIVPQGKIQSREETMANIKHSNDVVVVQGLPAAQYCQPVVKSSPSISGGKGMKRKKNHLVEEDTPKPSSSKAKVHAENVAGKSVKSISSSTDADTDLGTGQLVVRDEGDATDNDEEVNDFRLVPRLPKIDVSLPPFGTGSSNDKGARTKVRETLRLFQAIVRKLLHPEETKSKDQENTIRRLDLYAAKILKEKGKYVNPGKSVIGIVPGVEVGDEFHYRIELMIIGLHRQLQGGIDFVKKGQKVLATSIVASGGYANDVDNSDVLIYTGQGGNSTGGDKQPEDQKLERGNLALKTSIDEKNVVRVIRGFKETKSAESSEGRGKLLTTYTYDGLYTVEKYWQDMGKHGKLVFKFQLRRLPGQPELAWKEVKKSKKFKVREGRVIDDISEGKEKFPIGAVNTVDDEKPPRFTYINRMMYPNWCQPIPRKGCDCTEGCRDSDNCACAVKNGGEIPYNYNGAIVEAKPLVYECGPSCKCPSSCHNRVSQHGIKFPLEIFKTESRGWGVRSLSSIPSGSFICEYIGEMLDDKEAEQRTGNDEYLFDIGQNYNDHALWDGLATIMPDVASSSSDLVENVGFTIDAAEYGNVGRFINHSCSPNLYAQNVLYDHDDRRIPHIMFFAAENIPPLQELTYHYNYTIDQVHDSEGNIKKKSCYCGSSECTGRMY